MDTDAFVSGGGCSNFRHHPLSRTEFPCFVHGIGGLIWIPIVFLLRPWLVSFHSCTQALFLAFEQAYPKRFLLNLFINENCLPCHLPTSMLFRTGANLMPCLILLITTSLNLVTILSKQQEQWFCHFQCSLWIILLDQPCHSSTNSFHTKKET